MQKRKWLKGVCVRERESEKEQQRQGDTEIQGNYFDFYDVSFLLYPIYGSNYVMA